MGSYYRAKTAELEVRVAENTQNLRRLEAQRNELNAKGERKRVVEQKERRTHNDADEEARREEEAERKTEETGKGAEKDAREERTGARSRDERLKMR